MLEMQRDVEGLHRMVGLPVGDPPPRVAPFKLQELVEAARSVGFEASDGEPALAVAALLRLLRLAVGAAVAWGLDLEPLWRSWIEAEDCQMPVAKRHQMVAAHLYLQSQGR